MHDAAACCAFKKTVRCSTSLSPSLRRVAPSFAPLWAMFAPVKFDSLRPQSEVLLANTFPSSSKPHVLDHCLEWSATFELCLLNRAQFWITSSRLLATCRTLTR